MQAIIAMYCNYKIQLAISSMDDVNRLAHFYGTFGFIHEFGNPPGDKIMIAEDSNMIMKT